VQKSCAEVEDFCDKFCTTFQVLSDFILKFRKLLI